MVGFAVKKLERLGGNRGLNRVVEVEWETCGDIAAGSAR